MAARKPKIMFFDIEVLSSMDADCGSICCFSYKYKGNKNVSTFSISDYSTYEDDIFDDLELCKDIKHVLEEADVIIGHNSKGFDLKYINTRLMLHGLHPVMHKAHIDTYHDIARHHLKVRSRKLGTLARTFNLPVQKGFMDFPKDWNNVIVRKRGAMQKMIKYNKDDVSVLELLYDKICELLPNPPHVGYLMGLDRKELSCLHCGGTNIIGKGRRTNSVSQYHRLECKDCGRSFKGPTVGSKIAIKYGLD